MKKFDIFHESGYEPMKIIEPGKANFAFLGNDNSHHKCLPLKIAGSLGWDLSLPETFTVRWDGGAHRTSLTVSASVDPENYGFVSSISGNGILTFRIPYVFNVEPGNFLWFKGPGNNPLSLDLYPLEGLVECDWFPANITMSYKVTEINKDIVLEKGKQYCRVIPYPKNYVEEFTPKYQKLQSSPSFMKKLMKFIKFDKFSPGSKMHLKSYISGFDGENFVDNIKRVSLSRPESADVSKCPFHKLFKK